jgi:tetratricopeptide (TPR) repeat protein
MVLPLLAGLALLSSATAPAVAAETSSPCRARIEEKPSAEPSGACAEAIARAEDTEAKARLFFDYAFTLNEGGHADAALPNLDKALTLSPNFVSALHERAYTHDDLAQYSMALTDSDAEIALTPGNPDAYRERAFARYHLADFVGALADRRKVIELAGSSTDRVLGLAETLAWLGRYGEADAALKTIEPSTSADVGYLRRKVDRMLSYRAVPDAGAQCKLGDTTRQGAATDALIAICTDGFLHAKTPQQKADFLTTRAVVRNITEQNSAAGVEDLQVAAELDSANPDRHVNLGFAYVGVHHSWAARNEFAKALAVQKTWLSLAGMAEAKYNLDDRQGAFADAKASFEARPNDAALMVLGDLAHDRQDDKSARRYWMGAYHLGSRDDRLLAQLKSVGVSDPEKEPPSN